VAAIQVTRQDHVKLETRQAHIRLETRQARSSQNSKGDVMPPWQHIWRAPKVQGRYLVAWERGSYTGNLSGLRKAGNASGSRKAGNASGSLKSKQQRRCDATMVAHLAAS